MPRSEQLNSSISEHHPNTSNEEDEELNKNIISSKEHNEESVKPIEQDAKYENNIENDLNEEDKPLNSQPADNKKRVKQSIDKSEHYIDNNMSNNKQSMISDINQQESMHKKTIESELNNPYNIKSSNIGANTINNLNPQKFNTPHHGMYENRHINNANRFPINASNTQNMPNMYNHSNITGIQNPQLEYNSWINEAPENNFTKHSSYDGFNFEDLNAEITIKEVVDFVTKVREAFKSTPNQYDMFLEIMKDYKAKQIDHLELMRAMYALLHSHRQIYEEFQKFCPASAEPFIDINNNNTFLNHPNRHMSGSAPNLNVPQRPNMNNMMNQVLYKKNNFNKMQQNTPDINNVMPINIQQQNTNPLSKNTQQPQTTHTMQQNTGNLNITNPPNQGHAEVNKPYTTQQLNTGTKNPINIMDHKVSTESRLIQKKFAEDFVTEARKILNNKEYGRLILLLQQYRNSRDLSEITKTCKEIKKILDNYDGLLNLFYGFVPYPEVESVLNKFCICDKTKEKKCSAKRRAYNYMSDSEVNKKNVKSENICLNFISLLNLYTEDLITEKTLLFLIGPHIDKTTEELIKKIFTKYSFIPKYAKTIQFNKTIGSYKIMEKLYDPSIIKQPNIRKNKKNPVKNNELNVNFNEINTTVKIFPGVISGEFTVLTRSFSRENIYRLEDELHMGDILISKLELSILFLVKLKNQRKTVEVKDKNENENVDTNQSETAKDIIEIPYYLKETIHYLFGEKDLEVIDRIKTKFYVLDHIIFRLKEIHKKWISEHSDKQQIVSMELEKYIPDFAFVDNASAKNKKRSRKIKVKSELRYRCLGMEILETGLNKILSSYIKYNNNIKNIENLNYNLIITVMKVIKMIYGDKNINTKITRELASFIEETLTFNEGIAEIIYVNVKKDGKLSNELYRNLTKSELKNILNEVIDDIKQTYEPSLTLLEKTNHTAYFLSRVNQHIDSLFRKMKNLQTEELDNILNENQTLDFNLVYNLKVRNKKKGIFDRGFGCNIDNCISSDDCIQKNNLNEYINDDQLNKDGILKTRYIYISESSNANIISSNSSSESE